MMTSNLRTSVQQGIVHHGSRALLGPVMAAGGPPSFTATDAVSHLTGRL